MSENVVLVVEDEPDHAKLTTKILEHIGYEVTCRDNAKDAIEAYTKEDFNLCLLDIMLPDMNGDELVKRLRAIPKEKKVVMLAVTAHATEGLKDKFVSAGFDGYISKPFQIKDFLEGIKKHMVR